ncbi:MAG: VTT domain-containing protein [Candidatus Diapherotrites archaeon]
MPFFESLESLLINFGYVALFLIVFAESGLFFGFFLPGDSLLFTAGLLASKGFFDLNLILFGTIVSAILGDQVGYWMGKKFGRAFFVRPNDFFRDPKHVVRAEEFYRKHGKKAIFLARFFPVVRTFAPIAAGIGNMSYVDFVKYNVLGGFVWCCVFILGGYFVGSILPDSEQYFTLIIFAIIFVSLIPAVKEFLLRK